MVKITENSKRYFQYIVNDLTQLNSDVIHVFETEYPLTKEVDLKDVINDDVDFYAHCVTKLGLEMKIWQKVGNIPYAEILNVLFRGTNDYGTKIGEVPIKMSQNWHVWRVNDQSFTKVGKIEGENRNSYIGLVYNPKGVLELMRGNKYPINYPDFE